MPTIDDVLHRPKWQRDALCREHPDVDFLARSPTTRRAALQICGRCPVLAECREWSLTIDDSVSILGGLDPAARRQHAKQRRTEAEP